MISHESTGKRFWLRAMLVWLVIITAESAHGTLRVLFLEPLIGSFRARQISVFTAMLIIFGITFALNGWLGAKSRRQLLTVGVLWLILSLAFEISLGRLVDMPWERIFADYNLVQGGLMPLGMVFIVFAPLLAAKIRDDGKPTKNSVDGEFRPGL